MKNNYNSIINTEEELREILGFPSELVKNKVIQHIDQHCSAFIAKSPIIFISTSNKEGVCDVSPRGDSAGFVEIIDENYLLIPERIGNKRCDSLLNIISNPHIGIIFLIPGLNETLRVNGKAILISDEEILAKHQVDGKSPKVAIVVEVEECFIHCAKAFMRSKTWQNESWISKNEQPIVSKILSDHVNNVMFTPEKISDVLHESYTERLY